MSDQNSEMSEDAGVEYFQEENEKRFNIEGGNKEELMYGSKKIKPNKKKLQKQQLELHKNKKLYLKSIIILKLNLYRLLK